MYIDNFSLFFNNFREYIPDNSNIKNIYDRWFSSLRLDAITEDSNLIFTDIVTGRGYKTTKIGNSILISPIKPAISKDGDKFLLISQFKVEVLVLEEGKLILESYCLNSTKPIIYYGCYDEDCVRFLLEEKVLGSTKIFDNLKRNNLELAFSELLLGEELNHYNCLIDNSENINKNKLYAEEQKILPDVTITLRETEDLDLGKVFKLEIKRQGVLLKTIIKKTYSTYDMLCIYQIYQRLLFENDINVHQLLDNEVTKVKKLT